MCPAHASRETAQAPLDAFAASSPVMSALIAAKDWSATPLGPRELWSPALQTILQVTLANRFPVVFWWGPQHIQLYNDSYAAIIGAKHPTSLGQAGDECWAEIWDVIGPQIESVLTGGPSTWNEKVLLGLNRYGFVEETYFTFSYSPLPEPGAPGGIGGVLGTVQETTHEVIGVRRMELLRDLAARANHVRTVEEECALAARLLGHYPKDVPFAALYLNGDEGPRLCAASGIDDGAAARILPPTVRHRSITLVDDFDGVLQRIPPGPWPEAPKHAVIAPIPSSAPGEAAGFLLAGISSRLPFDDGYRDFIALAASQIGTAIAGARAYEEERKRAEALAEIDRAKNVFFSNVSHEFRTPLTLMLGPLRDLERTADEDSKPLAQAAHRNALRLLKLVNTLLEFSRLEAGRTEAAYVETDLSALTEELCSVFRSAIESAGLKLRIDVGLCERVYVDRAMWEKIVLNLLSNALKFTLQGEIRVSLFEREGAAELIVEDTGVGIPAAEQPHVFERFRRVRGAQARSHEGSGIGLALVKDLVELHGGTIGVQSAEHEGTVFAVRIPLGRAHLNPAHVTVATATAAHSSPIVQQYLAEVDSTITRASTTPVLPARVNETRKRVLVADDNGDLREYVTRVLSAHYDVVAVCDGAQALRRLQEGAFDAILSDVMMPQMDGFELLRAVRANPSMSTTPFIFLSARAGEEAAVEGVTSGADDYVPKPFTAEELLARVQANLNAASIREQAWELSEDLFHTFADRLPVMVWQQNASGAVTFTNAAWHAITRLPRQEWSHSQDAWRSVVHPDDWQHVMDAFLGHLSDRGAFSFEYRVKPADAGEEAYRWYVASAEPQYRDGAFTGWTGYVVDVHDARMRAERDRAFHALAEAIPVIVWSANHEGWLDWYNNRWYEYTGQTPEAAAGWGWQSAHHPEDFPRVMEAWPRAIATGERFEMEFRLRRHDGAYHWFLARAEPQKDEHGRVVRWYGSNVDIQAQKEALEQSRRVTQTLQGVFLPDALPHTENVRFDAVYVAAEKDTLIGGDWFDAMQLPDGRYLISIGDVTGHGLDASAVAGMLRQAIVGLALADANAATILARVNSILRVQYPEKYASALVGLLDRDCGSLEYACAGHPQPFLAKSRTEPARPLVPGGLLLGVSDDFDAASHRVEMTPDAVLAFYTDGLTEFARDIDSAERALADALSKLVGDTTIARPAVAVQKAVLGEHPPSDDVAVLIAQLSAVNPSAFAIDTGTLVKEWRFHSSNALTARSSRHELTKFLNRFAADREAVFTAELILGEILANTVEHAPGLVEIRIDWTGAKPIVTVRDTGPGLRQLSAGLPKDALDESGRGLYLIRALADEVSLKTAPGRGTELSVTLAIAHKGTA